VPKGGWETMATVTAGQRTEQARTEFNAFFATCPSREVFDLIADKWAGLLLNALDGQPLRHGELRRRIAGISQKMLTQTLRELERNGIVARTVTAEVPVRVDYALTPLGESLAPLLATLKLWAESHIAEIRAAREAYAAGV
jgi:DNA-binding HxlR family transcriptional regulator